MRRCFRTPRSFTGGEETVLALDGIDLSIEEGSFVALVGALASACLTTGFAAVAGFVASALVGEKENLAGSVGQAPLVQG